MPCRRFWLALAAVWALVAPALAAPPLPGLGADPAATTVSGISSGAYMAVQFHVAHSATVRGAGVIAGGPYYCAGGSGWTMAFFNCMKPNRFTPLPGDEALRGAAAAFAKRSEIDPTGALAGSRVWLFSGTSDRTVLPEVVAAAQRFYDGFKAATKLVVADAGHAMIVDSGPGPAPPGACQVTQPPFINDCDRDAAGELLEFLYGTLVPPAATAARAPRRFDQRQFAAGRPNEVSLADDGFVYVPQACERERCRVHVVFHGCRQSYTMDGIGERFVIESGYNRWADANHIVVLYPQIVARTDPWTAWWAATRGNNPNGCWDWWGYTGDRYAIKSAPQIRAVKAMVDRLAAPRTP